MRKLFDAVIDQILLRWNDDGDTTIGILINDSFENSSLFRVSKSKKQSRDPIIANVAIRAIETSS